MPKTLGPWIPISTHICVTPPGGWPPSTFPYLQDFCRQEAIEEHCELVEKPHGKGDGALFHICMIDTALKKNDFLGCIRFCTFRGGHSEDL